MSRANGLSGFGSAASAVDPRLTRLSSGWIDKDMVTIRKMAAAGETAEDIAAAMGWTIGRVMRFIRLNKLVWNRRTLGRHLIASAAAIGSHAKMGHANWVEMALPMWEAGARVSDIAAACGMSPAGVSQYFSRHKIPRKAKVERKRRPSERGMLNLIIRLHVEGILSEGQVATATQLDRVEIRRLAGEVSQRQAA